MIFVALGTQDKPFPRLLKIVEEEIKKGNIKEEVVVQAGYTKYTSKYMKILNMISMEEYKHYIEKCDLLITHGGVGTIFDALKLGKPIITCPRLKKYGEHLNDHQIELVEAFSEKGYVLYLDEESNLNDLIQKSKTLKTKKYKTNNQKMIKIITDFIDKN